MNQRAKVAVVEDTAVQRMILVRLLEGDYELVAYPDGASFLAATEQYDAVLMDIEMPGLNGYETCRQLKLRDAGSSTPVIFVSAHDTAPERVAAYEAGGDDFVTKPIAVDELKHKLSGIIEHRQRLDDLAQQSSNAQQIAFTAMISMGDLGVVIDFLRQTTVSKTYHGIAQLLLDAMHTWGLRGAVQIRGKRGQINLTSDGQMSPLQNSVLETMREMGRIFEMGPRAIINYEKVSLLVENLPTQDPDKVGRMRDHLAVLAESTDMRIGALDAVNAHQQQTVGIEGALGELKSTLARLADNTQRNRSIGQVHMLEALEHLTHTLGTLGLNDSQREYVDDLVRCAMDDTRHYFDEAASLDTEFADVVTRLEQTLAGSR